MTMSNLHVLDVCTIISNAMTWVLWGWLVWSRRKPKTVAALTVSPTESKPVLCQRVLRPVGGRYWRGK
jgi:hypothetical protein